MGKERKASFKVAAKKHAKSAKECSHGTGIDRRLMGRFLIVLSRWEGVLISGYQL